MVLGGALLLYVVWYVLADDHSPIWVFNGIYIIIYTVRLTYLLHAAVAELSKAKEPVGRRCGIQVVRKSTNSFQIQLIWNSIGLRLWWFEIQRIWDSNGLRHNCFEISDSIGLRFNWVGCQLISIVLKIKWFESQLLWDSAALNVNWFEIQMLWNPNDLRFNGFEI